MDGTVLFNARHASLGEILVQIGVITAPQLETARLQEGANDKNIGQILIAMGFASESKILKALSMRLGIPCFESFDGMIEPDAAQFVPEKMARKHLAVPLMKTDDGLTVGMINPVDIIAIDDLTRQAGIKILPVMTSLPNLMEAFQEVYFRNVTAIDAAEKLEASTPLAPSVTVVQAEDSSVITSVDSLLSEAIGRKASDIHLEAGETMARARFRVDGLLQDGMTFEKSIATALVARVKILARLDITETRLPQDGRLRYQHRGGHVDIRVSTVPSVNGEKVVLRLLDSSQSLRRLSDLGFTPGILKAFTSAIQRSNRLTLVTGPTGSGKTTTLYGALAELNTPGTNVVTLEDPVEYRIDRMTQIEVHPKIGLTFAAGLRAILRQDPNVILLGEIRDAETAEIAIQAAITGHQVISTLHTSDAVTAIHRLITMRVEPFLIAAALGGVMAQRLLRRLCDHCKKPHTLTSAEQSILSDSTISQGTYFDVAGCDKCFQIGYASRLAIHEWLPMTVSLRELILSRASVDDLRKCARKEGLRNLQEDALEKAAAGLTSLTEVFRVTRDEDGA